MKRQVENPQIIALSELPDNGKDYEYSQETGEITEALADVIGNSPYRVNLFVEKMGNAYQALGEIHTFMPLQCAICGTDVDQAMDLPIREIMMLQKDMPRTGKTARVNHSTELDPLSPDCLFLTKPELNVGEFVREILILNEPLRPLCKDSCENPFLQEQSKTMEIATENASPFAALKDFKLNS